MENNNIKLLLIDDNPRDIRLIKEMLLGVNHDIECVESLASGLERLARRIPPIDMVLLNLRLPDSEGINTFRKVHAGIPDVPVIVLSNLGDDELAIRAVKEGAQDYITKRSTNRDVFLHSMCNAIKRHRIQRKLSAVHLKMDIPVCLSSTTAIS